MSDDWLDVMFCCNNEHGMETGFVDGVEVGDLIRLEGPMDWDNEDFPGTTPFMWDVPLYSFRLGNESFRGTLRRKHVGNILWDSVRMPREEFCRLLNHLKATGEWSCMEAETSLSEAWEKGESITAEMLGRIIEA